MPEAMIEGRQFSYRYPDAAEPALRELTLTLEAGSFTVVTGESASGKTTLIRALSGLVPHFHGGDAWGSLSVAGLDVREHGPGDLSRACGTLFQDPESQLVMARVRSELALSVENRGDAPAAVARAVEEAALALGVEHLLERETHTLSGGELQRVALAAALVDRPALLALDEPTSQLDPVAGDELLWLLRRLNEEWGTTVVVAEHRLERCLGAADRVVALERGRLAWDSGPEEFLDWALAERPALATPLARLFDLAGLAPPPTSVRRARARLDPTALPPARAATAAGPPPRSLLRRRPPRPAPALELRGVWLELPETAALLRGIDLRVHPGERIALMGRNGAGKSTLLRVAKGLAPPTRGRVHTAGRVALLLQNPGHYLIHERVDQEAGPPALAAAGLAHRAGADPRDLSGGERQRLALELVLAGADVPTAVCLDEPTRGMDRERKRRLGARMSQLAAGGSAVVVATHDTEWASEFADRVVLMGEGVVIADGPASDVLSGGWHFAPEVARVLGGSGGALTPEAGAPLLRAASGTPRELGASGELVG